MNLALLPRPWRIAALILFALAAFALLAQLAVFLDYAVALFRFPYDYDQGEGFELYDTVLHAQGEWPYRDSQVYPFYTSIYPPLFHLLTVPLVWVVGAQLWTGRLIGTLATLVAAGAISWGVHRATGNRVIAALSGLTFLASNYTFHIGPLFRQHMTMVTFETLAIVALAQLDLTPVHLTPRPPSLRGRGSPANNRLPPSLPLQGRPRPPERSGAGEGGLRGMREVKWSSRPAFWLGLVFLLAAGYTKQMAVTTAAAALGFLFLRGPRRAVLAGLGLAAVAGAIFLWINAATDGHWFLSIIRANINAYDKAQTIHFYRQWTSLHLLLAAAAFARLIYELYAARLSAYAVWFVFAFGEGVLTGKFGAGESYFVTATAAACVLSGIALARLWTWSAARSARLYRAAPTIAVALAIPLFYLVQARLTWHQPTNGPLSEPVARALGVWNESGYYDSQGYTQLGRKPTAADIAGGDAIAELARNAPGPVFSEEAGFMFRAGKPVVTNPFPQLVMYQAGLFDPANEIRMIDEQAFGLVILRGQFYPDVVLATLAANYQPKADVEMNGFMYLILEPREGSN